MIEVPPPFRAFGRWQREGTAGRQWLASLPSRVADRCAAWSLAVDGAAWSGSNGIAVPVRRAGVPLVLKVTWPDALVVEEVTALRLWAGRGTVLLVDADPAEGVLLLERLGPGTLADRPLGEAMTTAATLLRRLAVPVPGGAAGSIDGRSAGSAGSAGSVGVGGSAGSVGSGGSGGAGDGRSVGSSGEHRAVGSTPPGRSSDAAAVRPAGGVRTTGEAAAELRDTLPDRWDAAGRPFPRTVLDRAIGLAADLAGPSPPVLVNRDLHYADVLAGRREPWLAVDPLPLTGDVEYQCGQLLWTRLDEVADVGAALRRLVAAGELDPDRARAWAVLRSVDYWLWGLAAGFTIDPARCSRIVAELGGRSAGGSRSTP